MLPAYAELHCRSNFSFLTGASHPEELVRRALELGYTGLALTDECSVAGVVRAHTEMKDWPSEQRERLRFIVGSEFDVQGDGATPGCRLVLLAQSREGYGNLSELITLARLRCEKGHYRVGVRDFDAPTDEFAHLRGLPECVALLIPRRDDPPGTLLAQSHWMAATFGERAHLAIELLMWADDSVLQERVLAASQASGLSVVAAGDVLMHLRSRKPVQDTLTAVRLKKPIADCGFALARNAEQHLRSRLRLAQLYRREWLEASTRIAASCNFSLASLGYEYPAEIVPPGETPASHLRQLTETGLLDRYPQGIPPQVREQIEKELALIALKRYEAFFLTVHDIVRYARSQGILCQGRGSAANSAVCYCLGITAVNPMDTTLLFERFISKERDEAPDIDVDFEHERREEVIQYVYRKYGTHRTALAAALASYRTRGAVRDVGKALGLDAPLIDTVAKSCQWFDNRAEMAQRFAEIGVDLSSPVTRHWMELTHTLHGFPRHLSQHVGGFVIARDKLSRMVPIETAAMEDRRVIQWDKDDLESLGLLKVDVLALGMLTALRRSLDFINRWHGRTWELHHIPQGDKATYDMICRADTVGVFQIESRAQMSMLPRLKPKVFYDLVIEVAIVRPGPIQGGMVHPYLKRRQGLESAASPKPELDAALKRTLGVPLFQEQVMQICMIAAGFSGGEADQLRRAMAAWKRKGGVHKFQKRILEGMAERGYEPAFAEQIFQQILGFGDYGFPESHAYSFALLAYVSSWIKCHEPAIYLAAMLNSQPMGFYGPSQLVQDARRHGVEVRAIDVCASDWDCTLEHRNDSEQPERRAASSSGCAPSGGGCGTPQPGANGPPAVRMGLRMVKGLSQEAAKRLVQARAQAPFTGSEDLARRASLEQREMQQLARADALAALAGHRRQQTWEAAGQEALPAVLAGARVDEAPLQLSRPPEGEEILLDYAATGLTLRRHPLSLLRPRLARRGWRSAEELKTVPNGRAVWACGIVTMRQQPETAKGTIFVTLEDETGSVNVIVWRHVREAQRQALLRSRLLAVAGQWQSQDGVTHVVARRLVDMTPWLGRLATVSRDFH
ncbi:MAG TPA: error-prone DNA polymerase [Burkholderiaceae bacterium]|nr:error-prone DNA polymerase [Burkholderiaceae bacterium]